MSNIDKLSNEDLGKVIKKYNINTNGQSLNRTQAIQLVNNFIISKNKERCSRCKKCKFRKSKATTKKNVIYR